MTPPKRWIYTNYLTHSPRTGRAHGQRADSTASRSARTECGLDSGKPPLQHSAQTYSYLSQSQFKDSAYLNDIDAKTATSHARRAKLPEECLFSSVFMEANMSLIVSGCGFFVLGAWVVIQWSYFASLCTCDDAFWLHVDSTCSTDYNQMFFSGPKLVYCVNACFLIVYYGFVSVGISAVIFIVALRRYMYDAEYRRNILEYSLQQTCVIIKLVSQYGQELAIHSFQKSCPQSDYLLSLII